MRITISGTPGSGKSTVAKMLEARLGYPRVNGGDIFREEATRRSMTLNEFGMWLSEHPEWDEQLDARLMDAGRTHDDVILEGRLTGLMSKRDGLDAFRIWMTAGEPVRIDRLQKRDGGTHEEAQKRLAERAKSERDRYRKTYGLDLGDLSVYDLVVETDTTTPENVVSVILERINAPPDP
ncbi:MAG: cytidylate kinase family protein [bacterium]|nr:cytidylate kinase family protein [bacterium]